MSKINIKQEEYVKMMEDLGYDVQFNILGPVFIKDDVELQFTDLIDIISKYLDLVKNEVSASQRGEE